MRLCLTLLPLYFVSSSATITSTITTTQYLTLTSTVARSTPSASSSSYPAGADFISSVLNSTNFYRTQHNASALTWNNTLATYAATYANNCEGPYGENLAEGYTNITSAVDAWGNERAHYNFHKPSFAEGTGHFTQLVWKHTTSVGCGWVNCNGKNGVEGWFLVCDYWPPGNVGEDYATEVDMQVEGGDGVMISKLGGGQRVLGGACGRERSSGMGWMVAAIAGVFVMLLS
ncbi:MAG: hypothetical protein FRX48_04100 [Lasallia pustulata]|uniref:SCP domain-containing protein n=1 Tax=Lasallia pustulata TaxID=136370 RepID=A0A5M8PSJ1_9LECA|nr:MAG: hypothetical protein FRX48_04100 [Lasallia pustulata]